MCNGVGGERLNIGDLHLVSQVCQVVPINGVGPGGDPRTNLTLQLLRRVLRAKLRVGVAGGHRISGGDHDRGSKWQRGGGLAIGTAKRGLVGLWSLWLRRRLFGLLVGNRLGSFCLRGRSRPAGCSQICSELEQFLPGAHTLNAELSQVIISYHLQGGLVDIVGVQDLGARLNAKGCQ
jgi:hypothetical protein